jgi:hypothetical protein
MHEQEDTTIGPIGVQPNDILSLNNQIADLSSTKSQMESLYRESQSELASARLEVRRLKSQKEIDQKENQDLTEHVTSLYSELAQSHADKTLLECDLTAARRCIARLEEDQSKLKRYLTYTKLGFNWTRLLIVTW